MVLAQSILALSIPGQGVAAQSDDDGPLASFLAELLEPEESFAPVELELAETLPRSATFQGVELSVDRVRVTNSHPYTIFGEPRPGELFYVVVDIAARNPQDWAFEYGLDEETFAFRTWSGQLLPLVEPPGVYDFRRLEAGQEASDSVVFGSEFPDVLDGAALLVGRPPDSPLVIPLTAPPLPPDYPTPVVPAEPGPFQAGAIDWLVLSGEAAIERPPDVCCPDTGARADDGEFILTLQLSGRVSGSKYGQATVSTDAIRLVVDGEPLPPSSFDGRANTPEGEAYAFPATWVAHEGDAGLALQFLDGTEVVATVPLIVGSTEPFAATLPAPPTLAPASSPASAPASAPASPGSSRAPGLPSAAPQASGSAAPWASGSAAPAPSDRAAPASSTPAPPTPRPVTAAIATLLIYSGRPDPDWSLTAEDLAELEAIVADLAPTDELLPEGGLGYRGFRITGPQGTWRANGGIVVTPASPTGTALADPERLVERYLLQRGLPSLATAESDIVEQALGISDA
jgi:hypothetical protein